MTCAEFLAPTMPTQDRVRSDQTIATQCSGRPPDEGDEDGPIRPVQARSWVDPAQDGDLVAQHEELDVLGCGRAAHQQDQPEHLPEDQVQEPQRHVGIMPTRRLPLLSDPAQLLEPQRLLGRLPPAQPQRHYVEPPRRTIGGTAGVRFARRCREALIR